MINLHFFHAVCDFQVILLLRNNLSLKCRSVISFCPPLKQSFFIRICLYLHRCCRCIKMTRHLTTIVKKSLDTRSRWNTWSDHRLWYHCWLVRGAWKVIHIGSRAIHKWVGHHISNKILIHWIYVSSHIYVSRPPVFQAM